MSSGRKRMENTLAGRARKTGARQLMTPRTILAMVLIGVFSFAAVMTLSGYAGDLRKKNNSGSHALSKSATGFNGIVTLLGEMGKTVEMRRRDRSESFESTDFRFYNDDVTLRIFTLSKPFQAGHFSDMDLSLPALIVLPKWNVIPHRKRRGWVEHNPFQDIFEPDFQAQELEEILGEIVLEIEPARKDKSVKFEISGSGNFDTVKFEAELQRLQTISGENLEPVYETIRGPILVKLKDSGVYILSEPDLLNTHGISLKPNARFALNMLDNITAIEELEPDEFHFDLNLHGFTKRNNIIKTMTQPPFLGALLCILAAGALIFWQGFVRFGDAKPTERDFALGKFSLVDNAARFIKLAERETRMSEKYARLVRRLVISDLGLSARRPEDIDIMLLRREQDRAVSWSWEDLLSRAQCDLDLTHLQNLGRDLNLWRREMTDEHR